MTTYPFTLLVDHVHDGDTIYGTLKADAGMGVHVTWGETGPLWGLRFYGINCPELNATDPLVRANAVACRDYLSLHVAKGDVLSVTSYSWDKYGLRLDGVPVTADGTDLCALMLAYGHGTVTM